MKKQLISLRTSVSFFALGACILLNAQSAAPIDPNPTVISGEVNFSGLETPHAIITQDTSKAIVDYSHFDVLPGGSVEFIQPGSEAAILNRITGNFPSMIEGMITANGQVYFVNPAGVTFGEGSIIRADTFLAAAGDLTNEDFLAGNLDFQLSGDLQNAGLIEGANAVALLGRRIKNSGEIVSGNGIVVLASGEHVYLQPVGSSLLVEVSNPSTAPGDGIGIDNQGSVSGDEILFSAGDAYSLALSHSGSATAASSAKLYSDGGSIEVSGNVTAQGGVVEIGGTDRGGPGTPRAARTNITESAVIDISAGESSNAGSAVIWADEITTFLGTVLGEGSNDGAGGSLEISAAEVEMGNNPWKISLGQGGKLLFDPLNVIIDAPLATNIVTQMNAGTFVTVDTNTTPFGGAGAEDGDIIVDAQIQVTNTANQGRLHLNAARDIVINQRITSLQPTGDNGFPVFDFTAGRNIEVNALLQSALLSTSLIQLAAEGGTVTISGTGAIDSGGSSVRINSEGDLTIASGAQILSGINTTEFGSVDLHTRGTFLLAGGLIQTFGATVTDIRASRLINQTGVNGISSIGGAGFWQIVLPHPFGETATTNPHAYGGLVSNDPAFYATGGAPGSFGQNAYAFTFQPTIDLSVNNDAKNYGDTSGSGFAGVTIDPTDLIDASLYGNVFKQDTVENILLPDPALASSGSSSTAEVGSYTITASSPSSIAGYKPNYIPGTLTINPRPVTLSVPNQSKTYGNTLTLDPSSFTVLDADGDAILPNGESIDAISLESQNGIDSSTTAGAGTYTDEIAITEQFGSNGFDDDNYDLILIDADLVVEARAVTLTSANQSKTYGNALTLNNTAFAVLDSDGDNVLPNGESIDAVSLNSQTSIDSSTTASVGTYTDEIAITDQTGSNGFDANNYDLSYVEGDLVIGTRAVTLTATDQSKTYGNALTLDNTAFAVLDSDGDNVLPNGESIDAVSLNSQTSIDSSTTASVGTYSDEIVITDQTGSNGFDANNYDLSYVEGDLVIGTRAVTLTAGNQSKTYGNVLTLDNTAFAVLDSDGDAALPNGETIDAVNLNSQTSIDSSTTADVGTYTDEIAITGQTGSSGFDANNYDLSYVEGDLVIGTRAVTLTATDQSKTYGNALTLDNTAFAVLDSDGDAALPNGESIDAVSLNSQTSIDSSTTADVGTYTDEIAITGQTGSSGFDANNYDLSYVEGDLVIGTRAVTLTAADQSKTYGNVLTLDNTAFAVLDSDGDAALPNGETIDAVNLNSQTSIDSSTTADVGTYTDEIAITGQTGSSGFDANNYDLSYVEGDLVIGTRAVTLTATDQSKTYGNALTLDNTAFAVLDSDGDNVLPNGESIDAVSLNSQTSIDSSTTASVGTYTDEIAITDQTGSNGFDANNYDLSYVEGDLVIGTRAVTLTAADQSKTYGNALTLDNTAFAVLDSDGDAALPNGESIDAVSLNSQTSIDSSTTASVGTYTDEIAITGQTGSNGFDANNYDLSYVEGDLVIGTRAVTLTAADQSKTYGNALSLDNTAFAVLDSDGDAALPNGETIDAVSLNSQTSIDSSTTASAGTYSDEIVITGQTGSSGFDANNYDLSYVEGDLLVDTRAITISAVDQERSFYQSTALDQTAFTLTDADGDSTFPNGELINSANIVSVGGTAGNINALPGVYTDNLTINGQSGSNGFNAQNYVISYTAGDLTVKGPTAQPVLFSEAFSQFSALSSGLSESDPRSNMIIFVPQASLLTLFGDPDWNNLTEAQRMWLISQYDEALSDGITTSYLQNLLNQARAQ